MTREDAILWMQVLKHSKVNWVGEQGEDEDIIARCEQAEQKAFDMAIEALSAEAPKPTGDLISREDAIEAVRKEYEDAINIGDNGDAIAYDVGRILSALPSAEAAQGEWIEHEDPYGFFDTIPVCSECGHTTKMRERYNYCPNCGARMTPYKGGEDE